jgi:hypothetical protein
MELKIIIVIIMNLGIFDKNFMIFWISGAIEINSEEIKQIKWINQGLRFNQGHSGYNLGTTTALGTNWI